MIDIPLNKALVAVEVKETNYKDGRSKVCGECYFSDRCPAFRIDCRELEREDGKNVIFKLVDLPGRKNND